MEEHIVILDKNYYGVQALSRILGLKDYAVRDYIRKGRIKGLKIGRHWWVSEENLKKFLEGE